MQHGTVGDPGLRVPGARADPDPARLNSMSPSISPGHAVPVIRTGASGSSSCSTATISWKNGSKSAAPIGVMPSAANVAR
jgi:hypothetical protein